MLPIVEKTLSTGADVAGIESILSASRSKYLKLTFCVEGDSLFHQYSGQRPSLDRSLS